MISYRVHRGRNDLNLAQVIDLYRASTLGERRPVEDESRMEMMLRNANLVVSAWDGDVLVGISRCLTDFAYATYLSDLAVRESHQRKGIGIELIRLSQRESNPATVILLAAPKATGYYPHIGMKPHHSCWVLAAEEELLTQ